MNQHKYEGMMSRYLGFDIGGTKCAVCMATDDGGILARRQFPTDAPPERVLERFAELAAELLEEYGDVVSIGISCGGPLNSKTGMILSPPNLPGWDELPVTGFFAERLGIPVFLQNDANACALAEWKLGAGRDVDNMIFCTMGTGFGCGLILNGSLYEGTNGYAGEYGHVRLEAEGPVGFGKTGSVEGFCGGSGIAGLAKLRMGLKMSAKELAAVASEGDECAIAVFKEVGEKLGKALSIVVDLLNPEVIVVGSIFARQEKLIRPSMEEVLRSECLPASLRVCRVKSAELGDSIGDWAAITVARE
ncbi:MAG: ROK family protein, partial [Victivallales bacterium]|nr:ROK family protein [Victivallales bacterium]